MTESPRVQFRNNEEAAKAVYQHILVAPSPVRHQPRGRGPRTGQRTSDRGRRSRDDRGGKRPRGRGRPSGGKRSDRSRRGDKR